MALDSALFTLYFAPRHSTPSLTDLRASRSGDAGPPNYVTSRWIKHATYQTSLLDGLTGDDLATVSSKTTSEKKKTISLMNPDAAVELVDRRSGAIPLPLWKQEWQFVWQDELFQITRESSNSFDVEIIRKPDPPIMVAMYRADNGVQRGKEGYVPAFLQIMDYNISRIENITDKRGLEHVLVLAITSCLDAQYDEKNKDPQTNIFLNPLATHHTSRKGDSAPNEVEILPQFDATHMVEHCLRLLRAEGNEPSPNALLRGTLTGSGCDLVILRGNGQEMAQRALAVAERTKVGFYRLEPAAKGTLWDGSVPEELFQYVRTGEEVNNAATKNVSTRLSDTADAPPQRQRARIKLGGSQEEQRATGSASNASTPRPEAGSAPTSITIYLSKSRLEELEAEQAAKMRSKMEQQSMLLAQRLEREEHERRGSPQRPQEHSQAAAEPSRRLSSPQQPASQGRFHRFINRSTG